MLEKELTLEKETSQNLKNEMQEKLSKLEDLEKKLAETEARIPASEPPKEEAKPVEEKPSVDVEALKADLAKLQEEIDAKAKGGEIAEAKYKKLLKQYEDLLAETSIIIFASGIRET